jgi:hypothetical protein
MTKTMRVLAMMLLFVVFPLVSWYYLSTGADWRRSNLKELVTVGQVLPVTYTDGAGLSHNLLDRRVCVLYCSNDSNLVSEKSTSALRVFDLIYDQFNARPELRLVLAMRPEYNTLKLAAEQKAGGLTDVWVYTTEFDAWQQLLNKAKEAYNKERQAAISDNFVCLSDIHGNIKGVYSVGDIAQEKKLVQHLAILLPLK